VSGRLKQAPSLLTRKEVRQQRRRLLRDAGGQGDLRHESVTHGIPIEAAQCRVLPMPVARQRPVTVDEDTDSLTRNLGDLGVWTPSATKGVEHAGCGTKICAGRLAKRDVLRERLARGRHTSPSRLKSATCLRPTRSTLAYTL